MALDECPVSCSCGAVRGVARELGPGAASRVMCYCKFCVTYAEVLGRSEDMLDERGGSDVFQISPRTLELREGLEHVACLRLTKGGPLRFYTSCCNTPLANTLADSKVPFMVVSCLMVPWDELGKSRDEVLGPVLARVNTHGQFSKDEVAPMRARSIDLVKMILGLAPRLLGRLVRGDQAHSPLIDAKGGPIAEPQRVERDTRLQPTRSAAG